MHTFLLLCWLCNIRIVMISAQMPGPRRPGRTTKPPRVRTSPSTINYEQFMKQQKELKEKRFKFEYNPSYGLEPYWADGDRVLTTFSEDLSKNITTTKMPLVCGEECNYMLRRIKHVCAHKSDYNWVNGCVGYYCPGKPGEDLTWGLEEFETYCEFLDAQCRNSFTDSQGRYVLVHIGKCEHMEVRFKPMWESWQPVTRMKQYITDYYSRHPPTQPTIQINFGPTTRSPNPMYRG